MSTTITSLPGTVLLPFSEMYGEPSGTLCGMLLSELQSRFNTDVSSAIRYGNLIYLPEFSLIDSSGVSDAASIPYWCKTAMLQPQKMTFESIGEAAAELKKIQRNWAPYQFNYFRRAQLIQDKLPYINLKPRKFPLEIPSSEMGLYTLLDEHTMIFSAATTSHLPTGTLEFEEDHVNPPSRAYLKIQESLSLAHHFFGVPLPHEGCRCFDAGACPGGWTYVLVGLGATVFAVDRAELAPALMNNPLVSFEAHDAFTYTPEELGSFDWVLSDVICYPERLLEWAKKWLASGKVKNMICTIKMQGEIDWPLVAQFASIPNSRVVHLNYNKHELTWIHCDGDK